MNKETPVIRDLIVPLDNFPHLDSEQSIHDAVAQLLSYTVNGGGNLLYDELMIINKDSQYVGRLTLKGILACFFPTLFDGGQKDIFIGKKERYTDLAILLEDSFQSECKRQGGLPVNQFMVPPHKCINAGIHPLHAAEIMMEEGEACLPVEDNHAVIGVVRLVDVFRSLAGSCAL